MANIISHLQQIDRQLELLLPVEEILQACRDVGYRFRVRVLNPALTVHLLILQLLADSSMRGVRRVARLEITRQAVAQAKARLPLQMMLNLVEAVCQRAMSLVESDSDWHGHRLVLADGTSCRVDDTKALRKRYGKASNQRGVSTACPLMRLLAVLDYSSGMIRRIISMPYAQQELKALALMFRHLKAGDLILADRGLISYAHAALMLQRKLCLCIRLPGSMVVHGRGKCSHLKVKRLGKQDMLVQWLRVACPTWMSKQRFMRLPKQLLLRQIAYRICRDGFRPTWGWIITDRLDPKEYPASSLIRLYERRWQVEVDFRDLKRTLGMKHLRSRTVEGVRKEVAAFVILYNLIRLTILKSAKSQHVKPDRVSFIDAADWLLWSRYDDALPKLEVNPIRCRNTQPRAIKDYRRNFGRLTRPRCELERPPCEARL
jgi:hypothetical protein